MRIGFDIDGVLANFHAGFIPLIQKVSGRDLFPANYEPTTWHYPQLLGYTEAEVKAAWDHISEDPEFWYRLESLPEAKTLTDNWRKILDAGHDVVFATARLGIACDMQTAAWLRNIGCTYTDVTITKDKGRFCVDRFVDCYIDDRLENVQDVAKTAPATRTYLLHRVLNAAPVDSGYTRVPSIEAFFVAEGLL